MLWADCARSLKCARTFSMPAASCIYKCVFIFAACRDFRCFVRVVYYACRIKYMHICTYVYEARDGLISHATLISKSSTVRARGFFIDKIAHELWSLFDTCVELGVMFSSSSPSVSSAR